MKYKCNICGIINKNKAMRIEHEKTNCKKEELLGDAYKKLFIIDIANNCK